MSNVVNTTVQKKFRSFILCQIHWHSSKTGLSWVFLFLQLKHSLIRTLEVNTIDLILVWDRRAKPFIHSCDNSTLHFCLGVLKNEAPPMAFCVFSDEHNQIFQCLQVKMSDGTMMPVLRASSSFDPYQNPANRKF